MDLNEILRPVDRKIYTLLPRLDALTSVDDVTQLLFDIMSSAHMLAVLNAREARRDRRAGWIEMSDREAARILKHASASDKNAIKKFYGSIAKSVSSKAMSRVREEMIKSTRLTIEGKASDERTARKAIGKPTVSRSSPVLETAFRTQAALAYTTASWVESSSDDDLWGYEYTTAGDERVRDSHADLDGVKYPKAHEFWRKYAPINGWNCRCALSPIYRGDKRARTKSYRGIPDVDPAFQVNFGWLFQAAA